MNRLFTEASVGLSVTIRLTETELAALEALAGYNIEEFLKAFYEKMGEHYLSPHEAGLRSLFASIRQEAGPLLKRAREARNAFKNPVRPAIPIPLTSAE